MYSDVKGACVFITFNVLHIIWARAYVGPISLGSGSLSWTLKNANGSVSVPAIIPGYALNTLFTEGIVGDPLYRFNELSTRWVAMETWTYTTSLPTKASSRIQSNGSKPIDYGNTPSNQTSLIACMIDNLGPGGAYDGTEAPGELLLLFRGLDTVADVFVGNQLMLQARNFHRQYAVDLKQALSAMAAAAASPSANTSAATEGHSLPPVVNLSLVLHPAITFSQQQSEAYPYEMPTNQAPGAFAHFSFLRKPASDWGWDWGPAFAPSGIQADVQLMYIDTAVLMGMHVQQELMANGSVTLMLEFELWVSRSNGAAGTINVAISPGLGLSEQTMQVSFSPLPAEVGDGDNVTEGEEATPPQGDITPLLQRFLTMEMYIPGPVHLWWPVGYGAQPLYNITATFIPTGCSSCSNSCSGRDNSTTTNYGVSNSNTSTCQQDNGLLASSAASCSNVTRVVGFRTIELVTDPLEQAFLDISADNGGQLKNGSASSEPMLLQDRIAAARQDGTSANATLTGESFYFRINGIPIFVQGSNIIPFDIIHTRSTKSNITRLLTSALRANMNMVRIWGGGLYQQDWLYEFCDLHGLLVWQEVMAACNPYPLTLDMFNEFNAELRSQVRRLAFHPSIAIWGGNNEIEASLDWFPATDGANGQGASRVYVADFVTLFSQALRGVVSELDPGRPYVDTSPSNMLYFTDPVVKRWGNPQDPDFGDTHYYNYNDDCQNQAIYPRAKLVSEFGFQSFPSFEAIKPYTSPQDWAPFSNLSNSRQRHPQGVSQLVAQLSRHFKLPASWNSTSVQDAGASDGSNATSLLEQYNYWIYLTQVQQALCYETALSTWRRLRGDPQSLTMGILYWQLNDIWPGYSWSSVNYGGLWKPLHYVVKRTFEPVAVTAVLEGDWLTAYVTSNLRMAVPMMFTVRMVRLSAPTTSNSSSSNSSSFATNSNATNSVLLCSSNDYVPSVNVTSLELELGPLAVLVPWQGQVSRLLGSLPGCTSTSCYISLTVQYQQPNVSGSATPVEEAAGEQYGEQEEGTLGGTIPRVHSEQGGGRQYAADQQGIMSQEVENAHMGKMIQDEQDVMMAENGTSLLQPSSTLLLQPIVTLSLLNPVASNSSHVEQNSSLMLSNHSLYLKTSASREGQRGNGASIIEVGAGLRRRLSVKPVVADMVKPVVADTAGEATMVPHPHIGADVQNKGGGNREVATVSSDIVQEEVGSKGTGGEEEVSTFRGPGAGGEGEVSTFSGPGAVNDDTMTPDGRSLMSLGVNTSRNSTEDGSSTPDGSSTEDGSSTPDGSSTEDGSSTPDVVNVDFSGQAVSTWQAWLAPFNQLQLQPAQVHLTGFQQVSPTEACFNVSASSESGGPSAALLVVLDSGEVAGEFSDNVLTLEPCGPAAIQRTCFSIADVVEAEEQEMDDQIGGNAQLQDTGVDVSGSNRLDLQAFIGNVTAVALNSVGSIWWQS